MEIYSLESLLEALARSEKFAYLYFWGHRPAAGAKVTASCCSQWFEAGFQIDEHYYRTAEHFMMAEKARLFQDEETAEKILHCKSPQDAKAFGRLVRNFDEKLWQKKSFDIVVRGNLEKFSQNQQLGCWLCSTAPMVLVEASPYDRVWGIGLDRADLKSQDPRTWNGQNLLGFALMKVRDLLLHRS